MWRCGDVAMCDVEMWRCGDVEMWRSPNPQNSDRYITTSLHHYITTSRISACRPVEVVHDHPRRAAHPVFHFRIRLADRVGEKRDDDGARAGVDDADVIGEHGRKVA